MHGVFIRWKKMVSGYYMRNIAEVFDLISGFKLCNIKCDCTGMKDIALSSDGNTLLSCADDGSAKLWDLSDIGNGVFHSADTNRDGKISLAELLRVIQFFNMGGYACANGETSDGYIPGPGTVHSCTRHSSDFDATEWVISLSELLRLVQFFNMSGYHPCSDVSAEDGFCPGPQE